MNDRTARVGIRSVMAVIAIIGLLVPPFSQIFCADVCSGGQCQTFEAGVSCDLEVSGNCCEPTDFPESIPSYDLSLAQLADDCQLCSCFALSGSRDGIVSRTYEEKKYQNPVPEVALPPTGGIFRIRREPAVADFSLRTHDPPLYHLTQALLI